MMKNNRPPMNCVECDDVPDCDAPYYGSTLCAHKDEITEEVIKEMEAEYPDVVNEPNHYKHGTFETIDEMVIVFGIEDTIKFCRMNAWKYRARAPFKGNTEQDMAKANCYLEMAAKLEAIRNKDFELLKGGKVNETR